MRLSFYLALTPFIISICNAQSLAETSSSNKTKSMSSSKAMKAPPQTKPFWNELKPEQQNALNPLQAEWAKISQNQKRKWLEVSKNFSKLTAEDQAKLHSRMSEWVMLSPQQRAQARLNFSATNTLSSEEKQKQWQAYQALSPEERKKLQNNAKANTPNSAALAHKAQTKILPVKKAAPKVDLKPE